MSRLTANLLLLVAAALWGSTFVVQKTAFDDFGAADSIGPMAFTGARFLLGALVVLPLAWREGAGADVPVTRLDRVGFVACGGALFMGSLLQQIGIIHTSVTNAGFLTGTYVPLVPVLALLLWRKRPHWIVWPAALGCLGGTWLLNGGSLTRFAVGDLWVLAGALFWALHVTLVGIFVTRSGRPLTLASTQFAVAGLCGVVAAGIAESTSVAALSGALTEILYAGILSVGVAFTLQVVGQRNTHPAAAAIILSSEMVFAALAGAIVLGERLAPGQALGAAVILGCIVAVEVLPALRRPRTQAA